MPTKTSNFAAVLINWPDHKALLRLVINMRFSRKALLVASLISAHSPEVLAEIEPYSCRNGAFPSYQDMKLGFVREGSSARSYFYDDDASCPHQDTCKTSAYIVPGDEVLVAKTQDGWSCVWYQGVDREFVGWMRSENLGLKLYEESYRLSDWVGEWRFTGTDTFLKITQVQKDGLKVGGEASWSNGRGLINFGSFDEIGTPSGMNLEVKSGDETYDCKVHLRLVREYLVVYDNKMCGGMNVNFDGVYLKKAS